MSIVGMILLVVILILVGYLVWLGNQLWHAAYPDGCTGGGTGGWSGGNAVLFKNRNLLSPSNNKVLLKVTATSYFWLPANEACTQGVWSYDGKYLTDRDGVSIGYVNGVVTPVSTGSAGSRWLYDGYVFYCADSFVPGCQTVMGITNVNRDGIIQVGALPAGGVGQPNGVEALRVV